MRGDDAAFAADHLIDLRPFPAHFAGFCAEQKIAVRLQMQVSSARKAQTHLRGIDARFQDEVVFQLFLAAVVDQIDPWIDLFQADLRERGDSGMPLLRSIAEEVVHFAGQLLFPRDSGRRVRAQQPHGDQSVCAADAMPLEIEHQPIGSHGDLIRPVQREEPNRLRRLTKVLLELERHPPILGGNAQSLRGIQRESRTFRCRKMRSGRTIFSRAGSDRLLCCRPDSGAYRECQYGTQRRSRTAATQSAQSIQH